MGTETFLDELHKIESKWQKKWQTEKIFEGKADENEEKWYLTIPYPYASGPLHIGHCRTYNLGDLFARYKRKLGYNVFFPMAYHITGTPILSVSSKIREKNKKEIKKYRGYLEIYETDSDKINEILKSFENPLNVAHYFASKLREDFQRMGFSIDFTREFTTGDPEYNTFIEWQYRLLNDKGYIVKGTYPILYCTNCKNAVGEDDIQGGDEDKTEVSEFIGIKYKFDDETYLVAATLRPETIFGATNIWVNPSASHSKIEIDGEKWIVSTDSIDKLKEQNHEIKIISSFKGKTLIDKTVEVPITREEIPIYPATFVDTKHATGIVYSVPAHAPYDYAALIDLQKDEKSIKEYGLDKKRLKDIEPISMIKVDSYGKWPAVEICEKLGVTSQEDKEKLTEATQEIYRAEYYSGMMKDNTGKFKGTRVDKAKDIVSKELQKQNRGASIYEVSQTAYCRCGTKIIVAVIEDQYFLNYGNEEWNELARKALKGMDIIPNKYRQSFENTLAWLDKRPCVRKRGLGTEFPITKGKGWIIESLSDSVIYMAFYTIIKQIKQNNIKAEQLLPEFYNYVFIDKGNIRTVSEKTSIPIDVLEQMRKEFDYWYPNDLRHTAVAHLSNHLSFTIFHHAAIFPEKYWVKAFSLNELLIREGQKMGKSKGNVIPLAQIPEKYSVDLTRLHLASVASADSVVDWREKEVNFAKQQLKKFWDYAKIAVSTKEKNIDEYSFVSKVTLSTVKSNIIQAIKYMDEYNARDYILSGFYTNLRVLDKYTKVSKVIKSDEKNAVIRNTIQKIIDVMSPVIPHIAEEINEQMGNDTFISIRKMKIDELTEQDKLHAKQSKFVDNLVEDIDQIVKLVDSKPKIIHVYINSKWKNHLYEVVKEMFKEEAVNIGKLMEAAKRDNELQKHMAAIANEAKQMMKDPSIFKIDMILPQKQKGAVEGYVNYISKRYDGAEIKIHMADDKEIYDPKKKANKARPMKPALLLE